LIQLHCCLVGAMARVLVCLLGMAVGSEMKVSSEMDVVTSALFIVENPPAPVKTPGHGHLRQAAKLLPPSVTVAAAIWAFLSNGGLDSLQTPLSEAEAAAEEVAEHLHLTISHETQQPAPETSSFLPLGWAAPLSLLAFGLTLLHRRRRSKGKDVAATVTAPEEAAVKPHTVQMFRISTDFPEGETPRLDHQKQPDEEPEPAHWKRMMTNLSDISDRPLELGAATEVFRMQTQEMLSSQSGGDGASENQPSSGQHLSSSSQSSPSPHREEALEEDQAEAARVSKTEDSPTEPDASHREEPSASLEGKPAPRAPRVLEPPRQEASSSSQAAAFLADVKDSGLAASAEAQDDAALTISARRSYKEQPGENDEARGRGKFAAKTPSQLPSSDTPRRGLNTGLIGAPKDRIREIASHLTSGEPPTYSPANIRRQSPAKAYSSSSSSSPEKMRKA